MKKQDAILLLNRYLNPEVPENGFNPNQKPQGLSTIERKQFLNIIDSLIDEGIIYRNREYIFIGPKYEQIAPSNTVNSNTTFQNCNIKGQVQTGNYSNMEITSNDLDKLAVIIEKLAKDNDTSFAESIINISKKAFSTYQKIKEWISLLH